jgi:SAM-dependent methyltransferase
MIKTAAEFDQFADNYQASLGPGIVWSGESTEYFARARIAWMGQHLAACGFRPRVVMDFGCGTGTATPFLFEVLGAETVIGVDNSTKSLEVAQRAHGSRRARFVLFNELAPREDVDAIYCNGVFHHIPPRERAGAIRLLYGCLRPGGYIGLWENNPWNPITHVLMALGPVDRNAIKLSPRETQLLLRKHGFDVLKTDFLFIFPKRLRWLRSKEHLLARWPLGIQYEVFCRKKRAALLGIASALPSAR